MIRKFTIFFVIAIALSNFINCEKAGTKLIPVAKGWAGNSINAVIFRKNSIVSNDEYQFVAYYNDSGQVVLAKRKIDSDQWQIDTTQYKGNIKDAHNSISIMLDGENYLHMAWNHHGNPLHYCKSITPNSLKLSSELPMVNFNENNVTYPEFYKFPKGDLMFIYRDGESGRGNLVMNYYDIKTKSWQRLHNNLIDGENQRNAYWQMAMSDDGALHLSWVWRETWDVATNHDMCYAKSLDRGKTWVKSSGEPYQLPITMATAEIATTIPQNSELINQTSMTTDKVGNPYIATYWRNSDSDIPQYQLIYHDGKKWNILQVSNRKTPFSLSGGGTKRIPISRPQIIVDEKDIVHLICRDEEYDNKVIVYSKTGNIWKMNYLTDFSVGQWEPSFDTEMWRRSKELHLFIQNVEQGDAEQSEIIEPQMVYILEWKF